MAGGVALSTRPPPVGGEHVGTSTTDRQVLVAALVLVGASVLLGLALAVHPGPNPVDRWGFSAVAKSPDSTLYVDGTRLGYPLVLVLTTVTASLVVVRRDRRRALACLVGPPLTALLVELAFKPLVGRHFEGVLSYPSGNVANVAAVATAWTLAVRGRYRPLAVVVGALATVLMALAVTGLRWHYPTDAVGGAALGVGVVLLVDSIIHLPEMARWLPGFLRPAGAEPASAEPH